MMDIVCTGRRADCTTLPIAAASRGFREIAVDHFYDICSITGEVVYPLDEYFTEVQTVALIWSSGAGKSTLINRLLGFQRQKVKEIREHDDRGRHATRHREMISLPGRTGAGHPRNARASTLGRR
jgi:ribosome biogenesis GTPase